MKQLLSLLTLSILFIGCAAKTTKESEYSGFLKSYKHLKEMEAADGVDVLAWRSDAFQKGKYHSILLDKVALYPDIPSDDNISKISVKAMLDHLDAGLKKEISENFKLATRPGPGVARLRIAITSVDKTIQDFKWYSYTPISIVLTSATEVSGMREKAVFLLVEAEIIDSVSDEPMIASVRKDFGTPVEKEDQIKLKNIKKTLDRWTENVGKFVKKEF